MGVERRHLSGGPASCSCPKVVWCGAPQRQKAPQADFIPPAISVLIDYRLRHRIRRGAVILLTPHQMAEELWTAGRALLRKEKTSDDQLLRKDVSNTVERKFNRDF
jgi:hypothetical protein